MDEWYKIISYSADWKIINQKAHGWGNHPGKSCHGLTNYLTLYIQVNECFEFKYY